MMSSTARWFLVAVVLGQAATSPVPYHELEARPLGVVSDLGQRLAARSRLQDPSAPPGDPRLLPSLQDLDAIKKVAQILVMLGEQVIPTIIGDSPQPPHAVCDTIPEDVPNDPVTN